MAIVRAYHTGMLLPNGQVLVAGGTGDIGTLASAELYDPAIGVWSATDSMATARISHTATLLSDGQMLVTGGADTNFNALKSAELYNPATGLWSATGSMATARENHTATLLPDGQVLVAGGINDVETLASAELYASDGGGELTLTGKLRRQKGQRLVALSWSPANGGSVNVLKDGVVIHTAADDGRAQDPVGPRESHTYQVCETDTGTCSNEVTVQVPGAGAGN
jgi:WD40 repeat protein